MGHQVIADIKLQKKIYYQSDMEIYHEFFFFLIFLPSNYVFKYDGNK